MLKIRKTKEKDTCAVLNIYDSARRFMRSYGNLTQWSDEYPGIESLQEDMKRGISYVGEDNKGEIVLTFVLLFGEEPTYLKIYDGEWLNHHPYATIHRLATNGRYPRMAKAAIDFGFKLINNIRIDTHPDNLPMQRAIEREGFSKCGIIICRDGTPRIAYQKTL